MLSSEVPPCVSIVGTFPIGSRASERTCVRAASVFSAKKNIVKERTTIERETYVQKGGVGGERETTRRERPWEEKGDALIV